MTTRTRTKTGSGPVNSGYTESRTLGGAISTKNVSSWPGDVACTDVTGNYGGANPFSLTEYFHDSGEFNGRYRPNSTSTYIKYVGYPPEYITAKGNVIGRIPALPTWSFGFDPVTRLLSATSPSRPAMDLPVFLFELGDLPKLVRLAGRGLAKLAGGNLSVQFGWLPLIKDLGTLLDFASHYDKKSKEIAKLVSKGGLRRNVTLATRSATMASASVEIQSGWSVIQQRSYSGKLWGSVRWKPSLSPTSNYYRDPALAFRAALGLGIEIATVWEALPWSWLIDYFTSIGDYLAAHRNVVPATATHICIMRMDVTSVIYPATNWSWGTDGGWNSYSSGSSTRITKTRTIGGTPTLTANLPFLDGRRLSILASLFVLYSTRR